MDKAQFYWAMAALMLAAVLVGRSPGVRAVIYVIVIGFVVMAFIGSSLDGLDSLVR